MGKYLIEEKIKKNERWKISDKYKKIITAKSKKEAVQFFMDYIYEDVAVVYLKPLYYQEDEFDFKHMFRAVKIS